MNNLLRKIARFVFGSILPRRAYRILSGPLRGTKFILGLMAGGGGGSSVYFNLMEPLQTEAMLGELTTGKVFFDIGANVGFYSLLASKRVGERGTVVAFEPVIGNLAFLHQHIEINGAKNVKILPFALSSRSLVSVFSPGANAAEGHLEDDGERNKNSMYVPTITLDEISEKMNILPDVLKIDVEGAEMEVFRGAEKILTLAKPTIFLSTHSSELRRDCLEFLRGIGYHVEPIFPADTDSHEFAAKHPERKDLPN